VKSLTSYASLTALVRSMGSDHVDGFEVAVDWNRRLKDKLEHAIAVRSAKEYPDAVFYDMKFAEFVRDQFSVVEKIYEAFDLPMSGEGADRMRAFIADNPQGKFGKHEYALAQFGLSADRVRSMFERYLSHYEVEAEG